MNILERFPVPVATYTVKMPDGGGIGNLGT